MTESYTTEYPIFNKAAEQEVHFIDKMGTDLSIVNAARVSFAKESWFEADGSLRHDDEKLIAFLARENHWTPFGHASLSIRVKAPIFVARQLGKHQVGLVWNEISRRYVDSEPEFFFPDKWRKRNKDKKQGSHEDQFVPELVDLDSDLIDFSYESQPVLTENLAAGLVHYANAVYDILLKNGICPEQARMILPQNMMTEWYWSGSLIAFARIVNLRKKKDTQAETRDIANDIDSICRHHFPVSWKHLTQRVNG